MQRTATAHGGRQRRTRSLFVLGTAFLAAALVAALPAIGDASSHREAPLIAAEPTLDNTDLYAFVSPDDADTVTMIANWSPFSEPNGGPNFYPFATDATHDINIDNDGDARPDIIYRWEFTTDDRRGTGTFLYNNGPVTSLDDDNLLFRQSFTLERLVERGRGRGWKTTRVASGPVAPSFTGPAGMPDYATLRDQAIVDTKGGGVTYAGQADDPFFLDLRVFDLLYGGDLSETGVDTLAGYNVNSVALQVPIDEVALHGNSDRNPAIGIWTTTSAPSVTIRREGTQRSNGRDVQVSRLGNPLVNEVVVPTGLKDAFNALEPREDATAADGAVLDRVLDPEVPKLVEAIYGIPAPATPRDDLVQIFLTGIASGNGPIDADLNSQVINADVDAADFQPSEMLRLNLTIPPTAEPSRLGLLAGDLQGFPNGRRLADDVVDIEVQALEGAVRDGIVDALAAGDAVDANDSPFGDTFPYLALPNMEAVNQSSGAVGVPVSGPNAPGSGGLPVPSLVSGALALALMAAGLTSLARGRREAAAGPVPA